MTDQPDDDLCQTYMFSLALATLAYFEGLMDLMKYWNDDLKKQKIWMLVD